MLSDILSVFFYIVVMLTDNIVKNHPGPDEVWNSLSVEVSVLSVPLCFVPLDPTV